MTGDLCSLIKFCFAFIMVNFSTKCVLLLFMLKIVYFKKCLNHLKKKKKKCITDIDIVYLHYSFICNFFSYNSK